MKSQTINYSIIIPHKEIPDLLQRCLDSIPRRDDVQIIVVDDNSRGRASNRDVADNEVVYPELVEKYPYVEWVWAKNEKGRKGAGYARNRGLERAKGKWLIFADADDFFNTMFFEEALNKYLDCEADMICFSTNSVDSEDISVQLPNQHFSMGGKIREAIIKADVNIIRYTTGVTWGRFIKRELVIRANARFSETMVRNDTLFAVMVGNTAKGIILDDSLEIYCYTIRKGSLCFHHSPADWKERYFVAKAIIKYLRRQNDRIGCSIFNHDFIEYWSTLEIAGKYELIKEIPSVLFLSTWKHRTEIIRKLLRRVALTIRVKIVHRFFC